MARVCVGVPGVGRWAGAGPGRADRSEPRDGGAEAGEGEVDRAAMEWAFSDQNPAAGGVADGDPEEAWSERRVVPPASGGVATASAAAVRKFGNAVGSAARTVSNTVSTAATAVRRHVSRAGAGAGGGNGGAGGANDADDGEEGGAEAEAERERLAAEERERERACVLGAAAGGDLAELKALAQDRADFRVTDDGGSSPLLLACRGGHTDCVNLLCTVGADPLARNGEGESPLSVAVELNHVPIVARLLEADAEPSEGLVMRAVEDGLAGVVGLFGGMCGRRAVDFRAAGARGETPLIAAARLGDEGVVRVLVDCGARVGAVDGVGNTALHAAARAGHTAVVVFLCGVPATPVARLNMFGRSALDEAALQYRDDAADALRAAQAEYERRQTLVFLLGTLPPPPGGAGHAARKRDARGRPVFWSLARHRRLDHPRVAGHIAAFFRSAAPVADPGRGWSDEAYRAAVREWHRGAPAADTEGGAPPLERKPSVRIMDGASSPARERRSE